MKANEFVKKFGWEKVQEGVKNSKPHETYLMGIYSSKPKELDNVVYIDRTPCQADIAELKRLVESWELVEKSGGLISSKKYLKFLQSSVDMGLYHGLDDVDYKIEIPLIKQAIFDVESCQ